MDKEVYRRGSHTVTDLKYHFVWKTKYSYGVMKAEVALRLRDIIREICAEKGLAVVKGNIRPNHVHILISAPPYLSPAKIAQYLKGKSSYRFQREFPALQRRVSIVRSPKRGGMEMAASPGNPGNFSGGNDRCRRLRKSSTACAWSWDFWKKPTRTSTWGVGAHVSITVS